MIEEEASPTKRVVLPTLAVVLLVATNRPEVRPPYPGVCASTVAVALRQTRTEAATRRKNHEGVAGTCISQIEPYDLTYSVPAGEIHLTVPAK